MSDLSVPSDPAREPESVDMIAAALRADAGDVDTLVRVLAASLDDTLPAGMVEVDWVRSLGDRLRGRAATPVSITVSTPESRLQLSRDGRHGVVRAEVHQIVRGVVISRREVTVEEWVRALAETLADRAARNSEARQALSRLLEG